MDAIWITRSRICCSSTPIDIIDTRHNNQGRTTRHGLFSLFVPCPRQRMDNDIPVSTSIPVPTDKPFDFKNTELLIDWSVVWSVGNQHFFVSASFKLAQVWKKSLGCTRVSALRRKTSFVTEWCGTVSTGTSSCEKWKLPGSPSKC